MFNLPIFQELNQADTILLAGAGGGYDIFCGLPLYFALRQAGKQVHLANLSFSFLSPLEERLSPSMLAVTADSQGYADYFPELYLCQWFRTQGEELPIYCFERTGVQPLLRSYQTLVDQLNLDTVVLVDGGTDSLMRGDEVGLGTPHEDVTSIAAVNNLRVSRKLLICLGFGVDRYHGVCHAQFLEAVAELSRNDGYLGMFSLLENMIEVKQYRAATEYVFQQMPEHISIVSSSILSALAGHYGNHHATDRTRGSKLWINPLMPVYWAFQLPQVAERVLYLEAIQNTTTYEDVRRIITRFRQQCRTIRSWETIPA